MLLKYWAWKCNFPILKKQIVSLKSDFPDKNTNTLLTVTVGRVFFILKKKKKKLHCEFAMERDNNRVKVLEIMIKSGKI